MNLDTATLMALEQAYQSAALDMDEIAPDLQDLQGYIAGFALIAQCSGERGGATQQQFLATYRRMKRCVEVVTGVATTYHDACRAAFGDYVEPLVEPECMEVDHAQLE